jgi:hypothetical protein
MRLYHPTLVTENGEQFSLDGTALGFLDWSEVK